MRIALIVLSFLITRLAAAAPPTATQLDKLLADIDKNYQPTQLRADVVGVVQKPRKPRHILFGRLYVDGGTTRALILRNYSAYIHHRRDSWSYEDTRKRWKMTMWPEVELSVLPPATRGFRARYVKTVRIQGRKTDLIMLTRGEERWEAWVDRSSRHIVQYVVYSATTGKTLRTVTYRKWHRVRTRWLPTRVDYFAPSTFKRLSVLNIVHATPPGPFVSKQWLASQVRSKRLVPSGRARRLFVWLKNRPGTTTANAALLGVFVRSRQLPRVIEARVLHTAYKYGVRGRKADALRVLNRFIARFPRRPRPRRMRARIKSHDGVFSDPVREVTWWRKVYGDVSADDFRDDLKKVAGNKHRLR